MLTRRPQIDSAFQLTEHLKALYHSMTHPPDSDSTKPISRTSAALLAAIPAGTERSLWLYELCRFLVQKLNLYLTSLFTDTPPCSAATCPEMRASEWQYLCAVHDPPKSCCAIDYCCHTLDWAANTLSSPKIFPSRLTMGTASSITPDAADALKQQERHLSNIFRRVYRIFAHAWFQHRDVFWRVEARTGLYTLFKIVSDSYKLVPADNYTIPPEAEGLEGEGDTESDNTRRQTNAPPSGILRRAGEGDARPSGQDGGAVTARRHKHALSRGGSIVAPVPEENEDEDGTGKTGSSPQSQQRFPEPPSLVSRKTSELLKPEESANPAATAAALAAVRSSAGSSTLNMSPVSPHAMSSADFLAADQAQGPGPAMEGLGEEEAKAVVTAVEGAQAGSTAAADPDAASKSVQD